MTRSTAFLAVAAIAAVIATGCGDDESPASGISVTTSSLSAAQYAKRADEICQKGRDSFPSRVAAYEKRKDASSENKPYEVAYAEKIRAALLPYLRTELGKLRALGAPKGDEATIEAILAAQKAAIEDVAGQDKLSDEEGAVESYFAEANELMRDYGIEECTAR